MENVPISPYFKRRIKEAAVRNYLKGEGQKPIHPFNVAPTYPQNEATSNLDDYGKKGSITICITCAGNYQT